MTTDEKLDDIQKKIKRLELIHLAQFSMVLLGFLGILSVTDLLSKIKK